MKALQINLPWGHALGDLCTCRELTGAVVVGELIAIHSGEKRRYLSYANGTRRSGKWEYDCPANAIVAVATFQGNFCEWGLPNYRPDSRGWQLKDVVQIEAVFCESVQWGGRGVWILDREIETAVLTHYYK